MTQRSAVRHPPPEKVQTKDSTCSEEGCGAQAKSRGLCMRHYRILWKAVALPATAELFIRHKLYLTKRQTKLVRQLSVDAGRPLSRYLREIVEDFLSQLDLSDFEESDSEISE